MTGVLRRPSFLPLTVLALLAYVPSLASSPGRMPADTKLYLYLSPGDLLGRAASTFEPDQFAGWVPHQQITYLWPSGPWYWLFDVAGAPDWVAHRLWIGTILFLAGGGVWWAARRLGAGIGAALVAAIVYQCSPYLLPYVSRTSLLLLPWAALGWLVCLAVLAGEDADDERRLRRWRAPALIALVVATVGSANATALLLIAPGPALWLVHAAWERSLSWRQAVAVAARVAVLSLAVSLWWVAMLVVQARYGAPVLDYSETLADVSRNSTGSEVLRGLGYWLFYVRDPFGPATTASADYLVSARGIGISYAVTLVGLLGLVAIAWRARRFAALLVLVGALLAVGVHPIDSPSPVMSLFTDDDGSGIALALRSTTRAVPLFVLGVALGAGALVGALPERRPWAMRRRGWRPRAVLGVAIALLAVINLPALWSFELVDPAIDRDEQVPTSWADAARSLGDDATSRVVQLPGVEGGAFRWGYTVDQPLVALTDRPVVTRDWLPLGSAAAMDLLYALDDRVQAGTLEIGSVAAVARLFGAATLWLTGDTQFERFRTARPEPLVERFGAAPDDADLAPPEPFGEPVANVPDVEMTDPEALADAVVGTPLAPVVLVGIEDPVGVVRAKPTSVLLSGSGDGIVDAAAAGLLTGREAVRYSAALTGSELQRAANDAALVVITDSNRDRAHHWRGSQDVHGHTEPGGPDDDVLRATSADQRLDVFSDAGVQSQTIAVQEGPVSAVASSYGEPFAYRPEDRAVMAVDGDPTTAWLVGDHGDPVGEEIALTIRGATSSLNLRQAAPAPDGRAIASIDVAVNGADPVGVDLGDASFSATGQTVDIEPIDGTSTVTITITGLRDGEPASAASRAGVGFVEIDAGLGPTIEYIRPPVDAVEAASDDPLAIALTRLRVEPTDPWRSDPEPELQRLVTVDGTRAFQPTVDLRLDPRSTDATLVTLLEAAGSGRLTTANRRLTGAPRHAGMFATDGEPDTTWITPFDGAVGAALEIPLDGTLGGTLEIVQPEGPYSRISELQIEAVDERGDSAVATVEVLPPDPSGRSRIALPTTFGGEAVRVQITGIEPARTFDRRYGDVMTLPAAIAEVVGSGIEPQSIDDSALLEIDCRGDLLEIDGDPIRVRASATIGGLLDGQPAQADVCEDTIELDAGEHRVRSTARAAGLTVDRLVLLDGSAPVDATTVEVTTTANDPRHREVEVAACPDGCWLVLGEGYNEAWEASADGRSLGPPQLVDGGFNGWWLPPSTTPVVVQFGWTAQGPVTLGLVLSSGAILACVAIILLTRRPNRRRPVAATPTRLRGAPRRPSVLSAAVFVLAAALLIAPAWGLAALAVVGARAVAPRVSWSPTNPIGWIGWGCAVITSFAVLVIERRNAPPPNAGWTESFTRLNGLALFAVLCIAIGAWDVSNARRKSGPVRSAR